MQQREDAKQEGRIVSIRDAKKSLSWGKKAVAIVLMAVFVSGAAFYQADASVRKLDVLRVLQVYQKNGVKYIVELANKIRNKDIAMDANIDYKKLDLNNN